MNEQPMKRRNPFIAFLLTFLMVGLGQFYCAQAKRGFILLGILVLVSILSGVILSLNFSGAAPISNLIIFGYLFYVALDAWKIASRAGKIQLKFYNKGAYYALCILFPILISACVIMLQATAFYKKAQSTQEHNQQFNRPLNPAIPTEDFGSYQPAEKAEPTVGQSAPIGSQINNINAGTNSVGSNPPEN